MDFFAKAAHAIGQGGCDFGLVPGAGVEAVWCACGGFCFGAVSDACGARPEGICLPKCPLDSQRAPQKARPTGILPFGCARRLRGRAKGHPGPAPDSRPSMDATRAVRGLIATPPRRGLWGPGRAAHILVRRSSSNRHGHSQSCSCSYSRGTSQSRARAETVATVVVTCGRVR